MAGLTARVLNRKTSANLVYACLALVFCAAYVFVHNRASFAFPIPWSDESGFLWPAISFQRNWSLLAPQLNPYRPILWMPPGYAVFAGSIFKVFGFSYSLARNLSMACMIFAFFMLAWTTRRYRFSLVSLVVLGVYFLDEQFVVAGNVARMEALLLLVVTAGFLLLQNQRHTYKGLALVALSPLIHPNGLYFVLSAVAYCLLDGRFRRRNSHLTRLDAIFILSTLAAWLIYSVHISQHWHYFLNDIAVQFQRKGDRNILQTLFVNDNIRSAILMLLCLVYSVKRKSPTTLLLALALPAWVVNKIGLEMWYQVFDSLAYVLLVLCLLQIAYDLLDAVGFFRNAWGRHVIPVVLLLSIPLFKLDFGRIPNPIGYPGNMSWVGMRMPAEVPYVTNTDLESMRKFLNTLQGSAQAPRVQFTSRADALFFADMDPEQIRIWHPLFHGEKPDVYILHMSRYIPSWLATNYVAHRDYLNIDASGTEYALLQRDETEIWYGK